MSSSAEKKVKIYVLHHCMTALVSDNAHCMVVSIELCTKNLYVFNESKYLNFVNKKYALKTTLIPVMNGTKYH